MGRRDMSTADATQASDASQPRHLQILAHRHFALVRVDWCIARQAASGRAKVCAVEHCREEGGRGEDCRGQGERGGGEEREGSGALGVSCDRHVMAGVILTPSQRQTLLSQAIMDSCDIWIPATTLGYTNLNDGVIGVLG